MEVKKILDLIEQERLKIKNIANSPNKEVQFFEDIILNNNFSTIQGLLSLDCEKIATAYLCSISNELDCDKVYNLIKKNTALLNSEIDDLKESIFKFLRLTKNKSDNLLQKTTIHAIKKMLDKLEILGLNLDAAKELYKHYGEEFTKIVAITSCINRIKEDYINNYIEFEEFKNKELKGMRVSTKKKDEIVKESLEDDYNISRIIEELSIISKHYDSIRYEDNIKKKTARKSLAKYTKLIQSLNDLSNKKLLDKYIINNILNLIENEEILKEFLKQLNEEHEKYFNEANTEYQKLSQNNKISIQALLKKYEIDFNKLPNKLKNKVLNQEKEELEEFLKLIKELKITSLDTIYFVLENSNAEVIRNYINLIKNGIITQEFLLKNQELLSINNESINNYNTVLEKIKLFQNEKINYRLFINDLSIYLVDYNQLEYNIKVLKQYNLLFGLTKLNSFELLKNDNLENKIDLFLELGYEKILENNLFLLNFDINSIKKLYILKNMNLLPVDINGVLNIISNKNFLDYIEDIDSYIFNIVNYRIDSNMLNNKEIDLNKYFTFNDNSRTIEINGTILSKNRIKRNILKLENTKLSDSDKTIYALVYDSILTEEEYNNIIFNSQDIQKSFIK